MRIKTPRLRVIAGTTILMALGAAAIVALRHKNRPAGITQPAPPPVASMAPASPTAPVSGLYPDQVVPRPLPVARSSATHEWSAEDATELAVIERIAHNPEEALRMVRENDRIKRRQLVYRKETVPMLVQHALSSGRPLKRFMLPGLDGREFEIEVTETHFPSMQAGSVNGRVKGRFNSMVSLGFSNGCESFNVISPDDGVFLTADAREPGEVIVKEIDPEKYGRPPETGTPDFIPTDQPVPRGKSAPSPAK